MATTERSEPTDIGEANRTSRSLIAGVKQDDPEAWERLVNLYSPLVYFWCRESGLPQPDLHDVFQDVFHTLARSIGKFQHIENGSFRGWLRTLTRHKLIDHHRRSGREPKPIGGTEALHFLEQIPAVVERHSTGSRIESRQTAGRVTEEDVQHCLLRQALANVRHHFAEQTWQAFWMVVMDGRETSDVAKDLAMRAGTVRVAKSRVLKRLRMEIGESID